MKTRAPRSVATPGPNETRDRWVPVAALGLVMLAAAWAFAHLFASEPGGLDASSHLAEIARLAQAMRAGDWSWWNPSGNAGFASGYYYQVLPQAIPAAFSALTVLAPLTCYQLAIFVPLVLSPMVAWRALRVMGADRMTALGAAVAVPFCVAGHLTMGADMDAARWGGGADGTLLGGLYTQLWAFVAFPLALAHAWRWVDEDRGLAGALGWGLFVGLCHPFAGFALGIAVAAAAGWRVIDGVRRRERAWDPIVRLLGLGALMVVGSASAWAPTLVDYAGFGGFPHRAADEVGPGFQRLASWLLHGDLLDHDRLPALTVLLPAALLAGRARWLPPLWTAAVAYAVVLGAGPHFGKTEDDLLPVVRFLGSLQIVLGMAIGGGAVLAARWLSARAGNARTRGMTPWVAALLLAAFALAVLGGARTQRGRVKDFADYAFIDRPDFMRMVAALRTAPAGRLQVRYGAECHWTISLPWVYAGRASALVFGGAAVQSSPNFVYLWALGNADPARTAWVFDAPLLLVRLNHLRMVPGGEPIAQGTSYQLRRYPAPGLVGPVRVVGALPAGRLAAREAALRWLASDQAMRDEVLAYAGGRGESVPGAGPAVSDAASGDSAGARAISGARAVRTWRDGSSIGAEVEARTGTSFVVRESWHPRWRATIDGAPAEIRRVTPGFMALNVPAGRHALALRFVRPAWTWLLWLLWPALTLTAWAWARPRRPIAAT